MPTQPSAVAVAKTLPLKTLFEMHRQQTAVIELAAGCGLEVEADAACDLLIETEGRILATPAADAEGAAGKIGIALSRATEAAGGAGELDDDWKLVRSAWRDLTEQAARARDILFSQAGAPALMA